MMITSTDNTDVIITRADQGGRAGRAGRGREHARPGADGTIDLEDPPAGEAEGKETNEVDKVEDEMTYL